LEWLRIKRLPQDIRDGIEAALDALLERNLPIATL
jgi:hypothetical protein